MATTRIPYNPTSTTGKQIAEFLDSVNETLARGRRLMGQLNSMSSGNDWAALEAEIGGMTPGQGQTLWTILATAKDAIDSPQVAELSRVDQG